MSYAFQITNTGISLKFVNRKKTGTDLFSIIGPIPPESCKIEKLHVQAKGE